MRNPLVGQLVLIIDRAYNKRSWHGTNLRGSIRRVGAAEAFMRVETTRPNIIEIVLHAAYWKYVVRRRLTGSPRGSFPLKGSDWFVRPDTAVDKEITWRREIALLEQMHVELRDTVTRLTDEEIYHSRDSSRSTPFELASGIAAHDLYHAGQIQLLKRLVSPRLKRSATSTE